MFIIIIIISTYLSSDEFGDYGVRSKSGWSILSSFNFY